MLNFIRASCLYTRCPIIKIQNCKNAESKNIHFQHDTGKMKKLNTEGAKVRQRPDRISMRCDSRIR